MKHFIALCLAVALFSCYALADGFDLTQMTLDELHTLSSAIVDEINSRFVTTQLRIGSGYFITGQSIREGVWTLTDIRIQEGYSSGYLYLYASYENFQANNELERFRLYDGGIFNLSLSSGMVFTLHNLVSAEAALQVYEPYAN